MKKKLKHLEFIQNIITRMNTNSFQLKGLTVTIVAAFIGLYVSTQNISFIFLGILPTIIFWFLDTYYLQQERKFRGVYNDAAGITNINEVRLFEMPIKEYKGGDFCFFRVFFSKTIFWLYFTIIVLLAIIGIVICFTPNFHR